MGVGGHKHFRSASSNKRTVHWNYKALTVLSVDLKVSPNPCGFNRLNISILSTSSDTYTSHSSTLSLHK